MHKGMVKKAAKIGDTCNVTINLYNDIRCQLDAIRIFNQVETLNDEIQ